MAKICPRCGKTYENDIAFCLDCGAKLVENEVQRPNGPEHPEVAPTIQVQEDLQELTKLHETVMPTLPSSKLPSKNDGESQKDLSSDLSDKVTSIIASLETVADMNLLLLKKINEMDEKISDLLCQVGQRRKKQSRE